MKTETHSELGKKLWPARYHLAIFFAAAGILIAGGIWRGGEEKSEPKSESALIEELREEVSGLRIGLSGSELDAIQATMTKAAAPIARSVVAVRPIEGVQALRSVPLYTDVQNPNVAPSLSAALSPGLSGIVIDTEGHVLTSANVARLGPLVQLIFADGQQRQGEIVGFDAEEFIGLVKISAPPANIMPPDFSKKGSALTPGQWLIRQGRSPSGRESVSLCLLESVRIGAKDRQVGLLDSIGAPEIDGGALIDLSGRVVGLYASPDQAPAFVVPIERALSVAIRLKSVPQRFSQSWVGLELQDLSEDLREYFGVDGGALITRVVPNSPAAGANLRSTDIVQTFDEMGVVSASQLTAAIADKPAGTSIQLGIRRGLRNRVVSLVTAPPSVDGTNAANEEQTLSMKVEDSVLGGGPAIVDVTPLGLANRLGLLSGDIIDAVNGRSIRRSVELVQLLRTLPAGKPRLFQIRRREQIFFIGIKERVNIE